MSDFFGDDSFASFAEDLASDMEEDVGGVLAATEVLEDARWQGDQANPEMSGVGSLTDTDRGSAVGEGSPGSSPDLQAVLNRLLEGLNEPQRQAVQTTDGPLLVLAGAGSGKTTVLTRRIAWILQAGLAKSSQILGVTFTNKAARELSDRLRRLCNIAHFANVGTFHSVCSRWLRKEAERLGISPNFTIFDGAAQKTLMTNVLKELNIDTKKYPPKKALAYVSRLKNDGRKPVGLSRSNDPLERYMADIYELYNKKLLDNEALDFDDILVYTVRLFREFPEVLAMYNERIKYIVVDEYQDVNPVQYELLRLLAGSRRNICAVGDDDQSIYKFRGADLTIILRFAQDFTDGETIKLEQNYRSTQAILDLANDVIGKNQGRTGKKLWSEAVGRKPVVYAARTASEEAEFVATSIENLCRGQGFTYGDFAILYRANAMSRNFEDVLLRYQIPHHLVGGLRFYERAEIKDLLAFFSVFNNRKDSVALHRILERMDGVGASTIQKLTEWGAQNDSSLYEAMTMGEALGLRKGIKEALLRLHAWIGDMVELVAKRTTLTKLLDEILDFSNYREYLRKHSDNEVDYVSRSENIDELMNVVASFDISQKGGSAPLEAFMSEVSLYSDQDDLDNDADQVTLMTVHTSKGLEYPVVFLVGLEENTLPSYLSLQTGSNDDVEEERRLCYVGMTRAKKRLFLSFSCRREKQGAFFPMEPSRFLLDVGEGLYDCANHTARTLLIDRVNPDGERGASALGGSYYQPSDYGNYGRFRSGTWGQKAGAKKRPEKRGAYEALKGLENDVARRNSSGDDWNTGWGTKLGEAALGEVDVESGLRQTCAARQAKNPKRRTKAPALSMSERYRLVAEQFPVGCAVSHRLFGVGKVVAVNHGYVQVIFTSGSSRLLTSDVLSVIDAENDAVQDMSEPRDNPSEEECSQAGDEATESTKSAKTLRPAKVGDWIDVPIMGRGLIQAVRGDKFEVVISGCRHEMNSNFVQNLWRKKNESTE